MRVIVGVIRSVRFDHDRFVSLLILQLRLSDKRDAC